METNLPLTYIDITSITVSNDQTSNASWRDRAVKKCVDNWYLLQNRTIKNNGKCVANTLCASMFLIASVITGGCCGYIGQTMAKENNISVNSSISSNSSISAIEIIAINNASNLVDHTTNLILSTTFISAVTTGFLGYLLHVLLEYKK
jgi:hypothetical protein